MGAVERVADLVPDTRFELFAESGHCTTVEEPERSTELVREFVGSL